MDYTNVLWNDGIFIRKAFQNTCCFSPICIRIMILKVNLKIPVFQNFQISLYIGSKRVRTFNSNLASKCDPKPSRFGSIFRNPIALIPPRLDILFFKVYKFISAQFTQLETRIINCTLTSSSKDTSKIADYSELNVGDYDMFETDNYPIISDYYSSVLNCYRKFYVIC